MYNSSRRKLYQDILTDTLSVFARKKSQEGKQISYGYLYWEMSNMKQISHNLWHLLFPAHYSQYISELCICLSNYTVSTNQTLKSLII